MERFEKAIESLLTGAKGEIGSRIEQVSFDVALPETSSKGYCHFVKTDANGHLRLKDLIEYIDGKIVEYAIPKQEIDKAKEYLNQTGSPSMIHRLRKKAEGLFTDLEKTGEGGEILLYVLVQEYLGIPQLISKMSLKTSGQIHYQGADGIHVALDPASGNLDLYWGEAKMYSNVGDGMSRCFESLKGFLLDPHSYKSVQERDLQLITDNLSSNVNSEELENMLVRYFDKDDNLSNSLCYKGVCFIGYDSNEYPNEDKGKTVEGVKERMQVEVSGLYGRLGKRIKSNGLNLKEIHVFLMPFPSVSDFRKFYLETIK